VVRAAEDIPFYEFEFEFTRQQGLTFVGDPDTVTREIKAHMKELGAGVIMGLFQFGSMPHTLARKNIELFARTVLPELKRA
jgi:alkanesulfonate monooxygenase SsuD/methylene tetrahydromethanopterin reductase-like flavin-dependent oxidoreductase (luciferase family)